MTDTNPRQFAFFTHWLNFPARLLQIIGSQCSNWIANALECSVIETNPLRDGSLSVEFDVNLRFDLNSATNCHEDEECKTRKCTRRLAIPFHGAQPTSALTL